jgi:Ca-activated chloride channel family protein
VSFDHPLYLAALVVLPLAAVLYWLAERRRASSVAAFGNPALWPNVVDRAPGRARHVPAALLLAALALLVLALAKPNAALSVPREEATLVVALDVSRSMLAKDVPPTRVSAAKAAAAEFAEQVPDKFALGLVAFATRATVALPATTDRDAFLEAVSAVRTGEGTSVGEGLLRALQLAGRLPLVAPDGPAPPPPADPPPAAILLISDGAQTQQGITPEEAATQARRLDVPIFTVALGTADGVVERTLPGGFTERIRVPPDPRALKTIADASGGQFFSAPDQESLAAVYDSLKSRLGEETKEIEITAAFAGAGALLLVVSLLVGSFLFQRTP